MFFSYFKRSSLALLCILCILSFNAISAEIATITLENGATVVLQDDFTWEYVAVLPTKAISDKKVEAITPAVASKAVNKTSNATTTAIKSEKAMDQNALLQSGLLTSAALNNVKVSYTDATWRDDELGLKFDVSSNNSDGVVVVEVEVTFYNDSGRKFGQQTVKAWQANYRQPETYIRKGQTRESRTVWLEGIDKQQWKNKLLSLKVIEVKTR